MNISIRGPKSPRQSFIIHTETEMFFLFRAQYPDSFQSSETLELIPYFTDKGYTLLSQAGSDLNVP